MMRLLTALLLFSSESRADFLSELFNSSSKFERCTYQNEPETQDHIETSGEPEHFSWELGTPDNLTPTEVIVLTQDDDTGFNE